MTVRFPYCFVLMCYRLILCVGSSRHSGTCHLDRAYDDILASSNLEALEAQLANLDALANLERSNVDVEVLRNLLVRSSTSILRIERFMRPPSRTPCARPVSLTGMPIVIGFWSLTSRKSTCRTASVTGWN